MALMHPIPRVVSKWKSPSTAQSIHHLRFHGGQYPDRAFKDLVDSLLPVATGVESLRLPPSYEAWKGVEPFRKLCEERRIVLLYEELPDWREESLVMNSF